MNQRSKDIYDLLLEVEKRKKNEIREEILRTVGVVEEYFEKGVIKIDKLTCRGAECKLCIDVCPTNALYWDEGEVKIEEDLCIFCNACVLSCIVDDCIVIFRTRKSGEAEKFSTSRDVFLLMNRRAAQQRGEIVKLLLAELAQPKNGSCEQ